MTALLTAPRGQRLSAVSYAGGHSIWRIGPEVVSAFYIRLLPVGTLPDPVEMACQIQCLCVGIWPVCVVLGSDPALPALLFFWKLTLILAQSMLT